MLFNHLLMPFFLLICSGIITYVLLEFFLIIVRKFPNLRSNVIVDNRWSQNWKPNIGGTAFIILFLIGQIYVLVNDEIKPPSSFFPLTIAGITAFALGLADDQYRIKPIFKLVGQLLCASILIVGGINISYFNHDLPDILLTYFWVVGLMNSINMLDNMDGIVGGVSFGIISWTIIFVLSFYPVNLSEIYTLFVIAGSLLGFLLLNYYPAKIFMGDKGSQFLGILLSYIGIQYYWNINQLLNKEINWFQQGLLPILIFFIPILDTTFVTIKRLSQGKSPAVGGKDHTTHHWNYFGLSQRMIAILYFSITIFSGSMVYLAVFHISKWEFYHQIIYLAYVVLIVLLFLSAYQIGSKKSIKN